MTSVHSNLHGYSTSTEDPGSGSRHGIHPFRRRNPWRSPRGIQPKAPHFGMLILLCQDNILLDNDFHVQIADFGLTRHSESTVTQSGALHYNFAAPELFEDDVSDSSDDAQLMTRTQKSDIYAFGCLYYEVSGSKYANALTEE